MTQTVAVENKTRAARFGSACAAHPYGVLTIVYILSVLIHGMIVLRNSVIPSVMDDEMLYMQLAESLYAGEGVLLRGQLISYPYLLYPLLISPLYALPETVNIFQAIICFNTLCINLMVFPVYALGREITGKKGAALLIACAAALMPDFMMAKHIMAESVAYPMILMVFLLMYRLMRAPKRAGAYAALGAACFLLYLLKPGYIAVGVAFVVVTLIEGIRRKSERDIVSSLVTAGSLAVLIVFYMLLTRLLGGGRDAQSTVYDAQTHGISLSHVWQTLIGSFKYMVYALIAFGVLPVAAAVGGIRRLSGEKRMFLRIALVSAALLIVGTAYVIYYDEIVKTSGVPARVHIRYFSFLLPVFAAFACARENEDQRFPVALAVALGAAAVGVWLFPSSAFEGSARYVTDAALLSAFLMRSGGWDGLQLYLPLLAFFTVPLCALTAWKGWTNGLRRAGMAFLAALLLVNQIAMISSDRYAMNAALNQDALMTSLRTDGDALYICEEGDTQSYAVIALEVNSRCAIKPVTADALLQNSNADGAAAAILPKELSGHLTTLAVRPYPQPRFLIFDPAILSRLRLSDAITPLGVSGNGYYELYALPDGGEWLHSGLFGFYDGWVWEDSRFVLCDKAIRESGEMTLWLKLRAGVAGAKLTLKGPDGSAYDFYPSEAAETSWVYFTFALDDIDAPCVVEMTHADGNIFIETYAVEGRKT